jgi:hypothetical protein
LLAPSFKPAFFCPVDLDHDAIVNDERDFAKAETLQGIPDVFQRIGLPAFTLARRQC